MRAGQLSIVVRPSAHVYRAEVVRPRGLNDSCRHSNAIMNRKLLIGDSSRVSALSNPALLLGFWIGTAFLLRYLGTPSLGHSRADTAFMVVNSVALVLLLAGFARMFLSKRELRRRIVGLFAIANVIVFAWIDPLFYMNQSPEYFVFGMVLFGLGSITAAQAFDQQLVAIGFGGFLFWLNAAWILHVNIALLEGLGGKWGVGMWASWRT